MLASAAQAATYIPTGDAFVNSGNSNGGDAGKNYGGAGALSVTAAGLPKGQFQSVLKFSGAAIKSDLNASYGAGQWTLQSITLQLTATAANNAIFNTAAAGSFGINWMSLDTWSEGTGSPSNGTTDGITFNDLPTYTSVADESVGSFAFAGGSSGAAVFSLTLSSGLMGDIQNGTDIGLRLYALDSTVSYLFNSRSFGTAAARPTLTVNAVPEPDDFWLLGVGGFLVLGWVRRNTYLRE